MGGASRWGRGPHVGPLHMAGGETVRGLACSTNKKWVKHGSKMCFPKNEPRPFGLHKQVKWALFEPIASHFGHSKVTKYLKNGLFWAQKWVNHGLKMCFFPKFFWTIWGAQTSEKSPF